MNDLTHFYCPRHESLHGMAGYRRHMDESHAGRTDCIMGLTTAQAHRMVAGQSAQDACSTR